MNDEKLFKIIQGMIRNRNTHDLHSFIADCKNGIVNVEVNEIKEVLVTYIAQDGKQTQTMCNSISATNLLEKLEIDINSIEM